MKVIGLTGGIGSGKSLFCQIMYQHGIDTIDTDLVARQVVAPGSFGLEQLKKAFGKEIVNEKNELNRSKLRELVFGEDSSPQAKQTLDAILHPLIQNETELQIRTYQKNNAEKPILLVAIPLLVEGIQKTGLKPSYIDEIWVIDCAEELQVKRAIQRDDVNENQILSIMSHQATRAERIQYAQHIIHNNGDINTLKQRAIELIKSDILH